MDKISTVKFAKISHFLFNVAFLQQIKYRYVMNEILNNRKSLKKLIKQHHNESFYSSKPLPVPLPCLYL